MENLNDKKIFRKEAMKRRDALTRKQIAADSFEIWTKVLQLEAFQNAKTIMSYLSFRSEVQTDLLVKYCLSKGIRLVVPISIKGTRDMLLSQILDTTHELEADFYGIRVPKKEFIRLVEPTEIDLVIAPGVAFSERCYRMGYGGGYYDNFLEQVREDTPSCALAFEVQIYKEIPRRSHDKQMDYVITEKRILQK